MLPLCFFNVTVNALMHQLLHLAVNWAGMLGVMLISYNRQLGWELSELQLFVQQDDV